MHLTAEIPVARLVSHWRATGVKQPQLLVDIGAWQEQRRQMAENWWAQAHAYQLAHHPLTRYSWHYVARHRRMVSAHLDQVWSSLPPVPTLFPTLFPTTPSLTLPTIKFPPIARPSIVLPTISVSPIAIPRITVPRISAPTLPTMATLTAAWPAVSVPQLSWPDIRLPKVKLPDVRLPRVRLAELPEIGVPHIRFPVWHLPDIRPLLRDVILPWGSRLAYSAAVAGFLFFAGPVIILESQRLIAQAQRTLADTRIQSQTTVVTTSPTPTPTPTPYATSDEAMFSLEIPALDIRSVVVPNVDPTDKNAYSTALKQGVAHAAGSALPDQLGDNKTIYLFAHSTDSTWNIARYNAQFYALRDAEIGQEINLTFWGQTYKYTITAKEVVAADDTSFLQPQSDKPRLILQTCYPPGTTWKRLLVIAE